MKYYIGIDIGTSGTKALLTDEVGRIVTQASCEYPLYQPHNGWAEQDPEEWWQAVVSVLRRITAYPDVVPSQIRGIGLSGQMHGLVMVDAHLRLLGRSIIWCDQRTGAQRAEISARIDDAQVLRITGSRTNTSFTAAKLLWAREHLSELWSKCRYIMLPKDYIRLRLTGELYTEVTDASGTQLMDLERRQWSEPLLRALDIPPEMLPPILESAQAAGHITIETAALTGLSEWTTVAAGAADNAAAALGSRTTEQGTAFATIGTSGVVFAHSRHFRYDPQGRVHTLCSAIPGEYALMGVTQAAGLSLKWFRDALCDEIVRTAQETGRNAYEFIDQMAAEAPVGADRLLYLPYLMGERTPCFDENCRGTFVGLTPSHQKKHLARAVMEGVAYSLNSCVEILRDLEVCPKHIYLCGGGAASAFWRQIFADVFNCEIAALRCTEGACMGAAILGAVACGDFPSVQAAAASMIPEGQETEMPRPAQAEEYARFYRVYRDVHPALREVYAELQNS